MVWPAIIAAGASIAGSLLANRGQDSNDQAAEQFNWNAQLQKEFAQHGVRWRVADAQEAGVHPLYALGAQLPSATPVQYVGDSGGGESWGKALGAGVSEFGSQMASQMARAKHVGTTKAERQQDELFRLQLERGTLENDLLRDQLARNRGMSAPAFPDLLNSSVTGGTAIPGQGDMPLNTPVRTPHGVVEVEPQKITTTNPQAPDFEAGANPSNRWVKTERGWIAMPSKQLNMDDTDITNPEYLSWALRNRMLPTFPGFGQHNPPPDSFLNPSDIGWMFIPALNEYRPVRRGDDTWAMRNINPWFVPRKD